MDLIELLHEANETATSLDDADCLHKAAEEFLGAYAMFDGYGVVAASAIAERVLGAAMMLRPGLSSAGRGRTVIFDVNIASGTQMARVAKRLRRSGNSERLVGIALHSLASCNEEASRIDELSDLIVAHTSGQRLTTERCDRSHGRVGLAL
ncbi:hypothetical protein [Mycobacteroides abscessus]|uniref:hypothetical protein n=1 Tax=Mycobacteroides abscessus TaxID=36809 RepID=UPI000E68F9C0|nr:hypothetical protein [Mycobacteroides abscessus]RIT55094.1 hypothetical protein D2E90_24860 [Mycobacteroides abscessus]